MVVVNSKKRLIGKAVLKKVAEDILTEQHGIMGYDNRVQNLTEHLAGVIDAHCILLQRELCVHCGNDVPLVYVDRWGEWLHNGEITCIAGTARGIMGIDPDTLHDSENYSAR